MNAAENQNVVQRCLDDTNNSHKQDDASGLQQFHPHHSSNIELHNDCTLALRKISNKELGVVYSKNTLAVGELLLLETEKIGFFMIALTKKDPHASDQLENLFGVSGTIPLEPEHDRSILDDGACLRTSRGLIPKTMLLPTEPDKSSRLGLIYVPTENDPTKGEMHYFFNGIEQPPVSSARNIPLDVGPLYVLMAMLPDTKSIRIVQSQGVSTLQNACRNVIRETFSTNAISKMELPESIKRFLLARDY